MPFLLYFLLCVALCRFYCSFVAIVVGWSSSLLSFQKRNLYENYYVRLRLRAQLSTLAHKSPCMGRSFICQAGLYLSRKTCHNLWEFKGVSSIYLPSKSTACPRLGFVGV